MIEEPINHIRIQRMVWKVKHTITKTEKQECETVFERGARLPVGIIYTKVLYGKSHVVWLQAGGPVLHGRDKRKCWVQNLKRSIHGKPILSWMTPNMVTYIWKFLTETCLYI